MILTEGQRSYFIKFREINPDIQIIGLSATVSNSRQVADWLEATLVEVIFVQFH